jgi:hypothetical protein
MRACIRAVRARASLTLAFHSSTSVLRRLTTYELQYHVRANHGGYTGLKGAAETIADPATGLGRGFDQQASLREFTGAKRIEPDAVGRLVDSYGQLGLYT